MKLIKTTFEKPVLFLLVAALVVGNGYPFTNLGSGAASLRPFAAAEAETAAVTTEPAQDASLQVDYDAAQTLFTAKDYEKAYEAFTALGDYSDSRARASGSKKEWKAANYKEAKALYLNEKYDEAGAIFQSLGSYKDSASYLYSCKIKGLRSKYQQAEDLYAAGDYQGAETLFESLGKFHDSKTRAQDAADQLKAQQEAEAEVNAYNQAMTLKAAGDLKGARDAFIQAGDYSDTTDQLYLVVDQLDLQNTYQKAQSDYDQGNYQSAYSIFTALNDYQDSADKAALSKGAWQKTVYDQATSLQSSDANSAYILFLSLGDYQDSAVLAKQLEASTTQDGVYATADALAQAGNDAQAIAGFTAIADYQDSAARITALNDDLQKLQDLGKANFLAETGDREQANVIFKALGSFHGASDLIFPSTKFTAKQLRDYRTTEKSDVYTAANGSKHQYCIYKGVHTWVEAKVFCEILGGHLATVTTPEENQFVYWYMRGTGHLTAYFGLSDEHRTGNWIWVTGEPYVFKNWHRGQPSRSAHERYGMYFYKHLDGTWNDSHFYELVKVDPGCSYICEWDE